MIWQNELIKGKPEDFDGIIKEQSSSSRLRKNKTRRKLILSMLMLVGTALMAGTGTYSWFTANSSTQVGKITTGTFKLDLDSTGISTFDLGNLQPGIPTNEVTFNFINSGSLEMILNGELSLSIEDTASAKGSASAYKLIGSVNKLSNGKEILIYSANSESIDQFNTKLREKLDPPLDKPLPFAAGDRLVCSLKIILDGEQATNDHQGDTVRATFAVKARQNVNGASFGS